RPTGPERQQRERDRAGGDYGGHRSRDAGFRHHADHGGGGFGEFHADIHPRFAASGHPGCAGPGSRELRPMTQRQKDWWAFFWFCVVIIVVYAALASWANGEHVRKRMPVPLDGPELPPIPKIGRSTVPTPGYTNGQYVCVTNKLGKLICWTWTNPVPHTMMTLAWTQSGYLAVARITTHVKWSTNGPNGPWTGDIPVACTNSNMVANIVFN